MPTNEGPGARETRLAEGRTWALALLSGRAPRAGEARLPAPQHGGGQTLPAAAHPATLTWKPEERSAASIPPGRTGDRGPGRAWPWLPRSAPGGRLRPSRSPNPCARAEGPGLRGWPASVPKGDAPQVCSQGPANPSGWESVGPASGSSRAAPFTRGPEVNTPRPQLGPGPPSRLP